MSNGIRVNGNGQYRNLMYKAWYDTLVEINVPKDKAKLLANLCAVGVLDNMEVSKNFDLLNQKVDNLDENLNQKIDNLDKNLNQKIDNLGENLNQKIDNLNEKFSEKFAAVDKKFDAVYTSINDLKTEFRWILGFLFAFIGAIGAIIIEMLSKLN